MAWHGVLGMIDVVAIPSEREARRRARTSTEDDDAIASLISTHRDATPTIDWRELAAMPPPLLPAVDQTRSHEAWHRLEAYRPDVLSLVDRHHTLQADIERLVATEEAERAAGMDGWRAQMQGWSAWCSLSARMLCADVHAYREAIDASDCLAEIVDVVGADALVLELSAHDAAAVLTIELSRIPALRGRSDRSPAAESRRVAAAHEYAAAAALRIARELLAVLPIERASIEAVVRSNDDLDGHSRVASLERGAAAVIDWHAVRASDAVERPASRPSARPALG